MINCGVISICMFICVTVPAPVGGAQASPTLPDTVIDASSPWLIWRNGTLYYCGRPFSGTVARHYPDESAASREQYWVGRLHGWSTRYYEDGSIQEKRFYELGRKQGLHMGYWPSGALRFELHFKDGVYHGTSREWYEDGRPALIRNDRNGKPEGKQQSWTMDGRLFANYVVKDGKRYGLMGGKPCATVSDGGGNETSHTN